jgi:putative Holliday junction resolvase
MPRYLGIDHGQRRIGLAISDSIGTLATPLATLPATGDAEVDAENILDLADHEGAEAFVVGLPLNMDGTEGPQAKICRDFAARLEADASGRCVVLWDERLSSFAADLVLDEAQVTKAKRKKHRDQIAAQKILQSYLDSLEYDGD